jgi:2-polyprenyl-3-methyl-5-hydroxy-6-metoxy-1,4-benzoquinol methylase
MRQIRQAPAESQRTIASYESFADAYSQLGNATTGPDVERSLRQLARVTGAGARLLEIGSGPGWEADVLERLGMAVRRTDATNRFIELQAERGKHCEHLNVITDVLGGPYDAIVALCVLIHVPRDRIDQVLKRIATALRPGGALLVSMRDGTGESSGDYHTVYWKREAFEQRLEAAGLTVHWYEATVDCDLDHWHTFLARSAT